MPCARKAALIENIVSWAPTGQKVTRDKKSGDVGEISAPCHDPMTDLADLELGRRARRLRVDTLVRLRWLAILGQSGAVLTIEYGLGFELPLGLCFIAIALSAWLNIALRLRFSLNHRLDEVLDHLGTTAAQYEPFTAFDDLVRPKALHAATV